ncbi:MAG: HDOD domain-containing protein [Planctomycetaceae bacterium]|nr:HDOD domain-containing protein [Planctomycetales bacterium]MCB9921692.1 HDOD domain-containing protein [Planctomycetaceae bacterium]
MAVAKDNLQLRKLLTGAQLPALPQSAIRLLELSQDPSNASTDFAIPIESDPGLTGQVLRFVNSSYFGLSNEISSIKLAIALVGIRTIKNFALWSAVFSLMPNPRCGPFDLKSLWQDSLRRAVFARRFGKLLGLADAEDLFAAALLQDMAVPLLAKELPGEYESLLEQRLGGEVGLSQLEASTFGWTHAEAGALIARGWHLPEAFASLIESHGSLGDQIANPSRNPAALAVSLSALLPSAVDTEWFERDRFLAAYKSCAPPQAAPAAAFFKAIDDEFAEFAPVLKLSAPAKPLAGWLATEVDLTAEHSA